MPRESRAGRNTRFVAGAYLYRGYHPTGDSPKLFRSAAMVRSHYGLAEIAFGEVLDTTTTIQLRPSTVPTAPWRKLPSLDSG